MQCSDYGQSLRWELAHYLIAFESPVIRRLPRILIVSG